MYPPSISSTTNLFDIILFYFAINTLLAVIIHFAQFFFQFLRRWKMSDPELSEMEFTFKELEPLDAAAWGEEYRFNQDPQYLARLAQTYNMSVNTVREYLPRLTAIEQCVGDRMTNCAFCGKTTEEMCVCQAIRICSDECRQAVVLSTS